MAHKTTRTAKHGHDARVLRTRGALKIAIIDLLGRFELAQITARMVVAEAGIGYATFFRHYEDVDALLGDVAADMVAEVGPELHRVAATGDGQMMARRIIDFVAAHKRVCRALLVGAGERSRRNILRNALSVASINPAIMSAPMPPSLALNHLVTVCFATMAWWLESAPEMPHDDIADMLDRLAFRPLRS